MESGQRRSTEPVWMNNNEVPSLRDRVADNNIGALTFWEDRLLRGYKFRPTDEELVVHYLMKKVAGLELPLNKIPDADLYGFSHPLELTGMYPRPYDYEYWYFFTTRNRKYPNGVRPNRATEGGFWKPTGVDAKVRHNGRLVGYKRLLEFYEGKDLGRKRTDWKMYEYRIHEKATLPSNVDGADPMKLDEWVLCKIHKSTMGKKDNNQTDDDARGGQHDHGNGEYVGFDPPQVRSSQPIHSSSDHQVQSDQSNNMDVVPINGPQETTPSCSSNLPAVPMYRSLPQLPAEFGFLDDIFIDNDDDDDVLVNEVLSLFNDDGVLDLGNGEYVSFDPPQVRSSQPICSSSDQAQSDQSKMDLVPINGPQETTPSSSNLPAVPVSVDNVDNDDDDVLDFPLCELSQVVVSRRASSSPVIPKEPSDSSSALP